MMNLLSLHILLFFNCYFFLTVPSIFHRSIVSVLFAYCIRAHKTNNTHKAFEAFALHLIQPFCLFVCACLILLLFNHFFKLVNGKYILKALAQMQIPNIKKQKHNTRKGMRTSDLSILIIENSSR